VQGAFVRHLQVLRVELLAQGILEPSNAIHSNEDPCSRLYGRR
jgi:hypothetical protein